MTRLIDADDFFRTFPELAIEPYINAPTIPLPDFKEGYKQAILDGKTNFSRPQGKWIPVSERLPEEKINLYTSDFDEVLCTTDWGEVRAFKFGTPILHHEPHFWLGGAIMDKHIIAWQPLPEPYKEADNERI